MVEARDPARPDRERENFEVAMAFGQARIEYKTNAQMRTMHEAGLVLSRALDAAVAAAAPGVTTARLDEVFAAVLQDAGAKSNFLGYHGSRPPSAPRSTRKWCTGSPAAGSSRTAISSRSTA